MRKKPDPNNPSSTFFWKDYENDEGLRVSSLAAQGLWMRLLCVAAKADPYGYVVINGCEIGVTGAAKLGSVSETEAATLLDELERNGVFSRDRRGRIFSRRMLKEAAARKKARENGKKGGNPALSLSSGKETEKSDPVNLEDKAPDKPPYPYPIPSSLRSENTGRGVARAREDNVPQPPPDPPEGEDLIWRILHGLGFDRGQVIPKFWMAPDAPLIVERWRSTVGLSDDEIVRVAVRNAAQHGEPARGPKVLTPAMEAYAAAKAAQTLQPEPKPRGAGHDRRSERQAFDATIAAVADGLSAGTINLETASRDPFAERSGGDAVAGQRGAGALLRPG